jgi:hypothetical protein
MHPSRQEKIRRGKGRKTDVCGLSFSLVFSFLLGILDLLDTACVVRFFL